MRRIYRCGLAVWLVALLFVPAFGTTAGAKEAKENGWYAMPAIDEAVLGFQYNADGDTGAAAVGTKPFWVDMVDAEQVDYTGKDVYIAVLDTGLRDIWDQYFNTANICTGLAKGFSYEISYDTSTDEFSLGELKTDRGIINKDIGSGHGTHVVSTIIGYNARLPAGIFFIRGVAPDAKIIPVLVLDTWLVSCEKDSVSNIPLTSDGPHGTDADGYKMMFTGGTWAMVKAGIDYVTGLAKNELKGSKVIISMSLGGASKNAEVRAAIKNAIDAGVIVVAAAGNEGTSGMSWPGAYDEVISCAAAGWTETYIAAKTTPPTYGPQFWRYDVPEELETEDYWGNDWQIHLMKFSSRPSKDLDQKSSDLDLSDPGYYVLGPYQYETYWSGTAWRKYIEDYPKGPPKFYYRDTFWYLSGTSMATPHASAIAAIVLEWAADDDGGDGVDLTQKHMEKILKNGAVQNWPPGDYKGATFYNAHIPGIQDVTWDRNDWGKGLLQADDALAAAEDYVDENF